MHIDLGFLFWRIGVGFIMHVNPNVLSIGGGLAINPHGDHPHIVGSISLLFVHFSLSLTFCIHSKDHI